MLYKNTRLIEVSDWDELVEKTYGKPYNFQQQEGCRDRGTFSLTVPSDFDNEEDMNDSIPDNANDEEMGVKFEVWLSRDPNQPLENQMYEWENKLFWERNFYPSIYTLANDLHSKGLLEAGEYLINIDW